MNIKELTYLLQHPHTLNKEQTKSLEKLAREFPYFQSIKPLILKGLKDQESFRYNQELKTTAAYTIDRSVLFNFITSDLFQKDKAAPSKEKKHNSEIDVIDPKEVKTLQRIDMDEAVKMKMKEAEDVLDPSLFSARQEESTTPQEAPVSESIPDPQSDISIIATDTSEKTEEEIQTDAPLNFDKKETHSFAEWLKLTSVKPVSPNSNNDEPPTSLPEKQEDKVSDKGLDKEEKFNLIDEFIANSPKITPAPKNSPSRNLAKENQVSTDELMTETLAKVYLAQKNYKKAIQAYNILILKNPEKSGFFADQIRAIKKLQENK